MLMRMINWYMVMRLRNLMKRMRSWMSLKYLVLLSDWRKLLMSYDRSIVIVFGVNLNMLMKKNW